MKKIILIISAFVMSLAGKSQVSDYQNWMSQLDNNAFVCQLSLPGAHDACSSKFSGASGLLAGVSGKVQTKSVTEMLEAGVRVFDLRPNNKMTICHGWLKTSYTLSSAMENLRDYISNHPTEFCVVVMRHETDGDDGDSDFASTLQTTLASFSNYLIDFRPNLTVGETRGKIIFLSRDDYGTPIRGGSITGWPGNTSGNNGQGYGSETYKCPFWVQDNYEYSDVNDKKNAIQAMLSQSYQLAGKYNYTWVINETSGYKGSGLVSNCQTNAKNCNPHLQQLLASGNYNGPAGLVFMDFCCDGNNSGYYGLSLTRELINHNFRYTMSKQGDPICDDNGNLYVAPKGQVMMWEARTLSITSPTSTDEASAVAGPAGWYDLDFDDSGSDWQARRYPTATGTNDPYYSSWNGENNVLFIRREFNIDHDPTIDTYTLFFCHDDDCQIYLNGSTLTSEGGWIGEYHTFAIPSERLNIGRNVLAIRQQQGSGGAYFDCGVLRTEATQAPLTLTGTNWQSYVAPGHNLDFSTTNVKAYKITEISGNNTSAHLEEVSAVPADAAVIVRSDNGAATYQIPVTQTSASMDDNMLKAAISPLTVTTANTIYCLANKNGKIGFYPVAVGVTVPKGKAYLDFSDASVKPASIILDNEDNATIITEVAEKAENTAIYNTAGQRISKLPKGIYIIDGKKVLR